MVKLAVQNKAPSLNVLGANDRIGVAVVGLTWCNGFGQNHLFGIHEKATENNTRIVAACDVFSRYRRWGVQRANLRESQVYADYRRLLERSDVDAVVVATHEPLHANTTIDALDAGKHVYCEKPLTRYLGEAFQVYDKVKSTGRVFQLGAATCSAGAWQKCAKLIQAGKIGTPVWGQGYYCRNSIGGEWNYLIDPEATPENIDWEKWLGPVQPRVPFSAEHFCRWNKYYRYSTGLLGVLASSRLHALMLATGNLEFPRRVNCVSTHNLHSDLTTPRTPERDVPEHVQFLSEFPSGLLLTITCSSVNGRSPGFAIYGHKATLIAGSAGERLDLVPEKEFDREIEPQEFNGLQPEDIRFHEKNWFDCIRSGKAPNANIDLAIRAQTVLSLAEMADRLKITCLFDEKTRRIIDGAGNVIAPITYGTLDAS